MIKEDDLLISELKLSDLQNLTETLIKVIKVSDGEIKKKTKNTLSEVIGFIDKALKKEIITPVQYRKIIFGAAGGREEAIKLIENSNRREDKLSKRPKRSKGDNQ